MAKRKTVKEKVEAAIEEVAKQLPRAESPEQAKEIEEAVQELNDILDMGDDVVAEGPAKEKIKVGLHPITGEAVYL